MKKYYRSRSCFNLVDCVLLFLILLQTLKIEQSIHYGMLNYRKQFYLQKDSPCHSKCASSPILNDLCTLCSSTALTSFRRKNAAELRHKLRQNSSEVSIVFVGLTFSGGAGTLAPHSQDNFQLRVAVWGHKFSTVSAGYKYSFLLNDVVSCQIPPQFLLHFQVCERMCMSF